MSATRRFPPPWTVRELESAFAVADANGQAFAYVYFRRDPNEARQAGVLLRDEARRIARGITRLPELMASRDVEPMPDDPEGMIAWGRRNIQGEEQRGTLATLLVTESAGPGTGPPASRNMPP